LAVLRKVFRSSRWTRPHWPLLLRSS